MIFDYTQLETPSCHLPTRTPHATLKRVIFDSTIRNLKCPLPPAHKRASQPQTVIFRSPFNLATPMRKRAGHSGAPTTPPPRPKNKISRSGERKQKGQLPRPGLCYPEAELVTPELAGTPQSGWVSREKERWKDTKAYFRSEPQQTAKNGPTKDK